MVSMPQNTVVVSFICRGLPHVQGQGGEILYFTPPKLRREQARGADPNALQHYIINDGDYGPGAPVPTTTLEASCLSIRANVFLTANAKDPSNSDLNLVRQGKRLPWEGGQFLQAFLWRVTESYERGLSHEGELIAAQRERRQARPPPEVLRPLYQDDLMTYRLVEQKLGPNHHGWEQYVRLDNPEMMPEEFIATSYYSVIVPPTLDRLLVDIPAAQHLTALDLSEACLDLTCELITKQVGHHTSRSWAPGVPLPTSELTTIPDGVLKHRVYSYFLDVVTFYLRRARPALETAITSTFLRAMQPVQSLVTDPTVSLAAFEASFFKACTYELARAKLSGGHLEKMAVGRILEWKDDPKAGKKRPFLHVLALGGTPAVFGSLRELVYYLLTVSSHPYSVLNPNANVMTKEMEREWRTRPDLLRITIPECRPTCEGGWLAMMVQDVVDSSAERAKQLREMTRSHSEPLGSRLTNVPRPQGVNLPDGLRERLARVDGSRPSGSLGALLKAHTQDTAPPGATAVEVESIVDLAIFSIPPDPDNPLIVLIGAERVLPGSSDIVAPTGSRTVAQWAKAELKAKVYALFSTEVIESSHRSRELTPTEGSADDICGLWKGSPHFEGVDTGSLAKKLKVTNRMNEVVPAKYIDFYITENGVLSAGGCVELGKERGAAEKAVFGETD